MAGDGKEGKEEEVPTTAAACSSKEEEDSANRTTGKRELPRVRSEEYDETLTWSLFLDYQETERRGDWGAQRDVEPKKKEKRKRRRKTDTSGGCGVRRRGRGRLRGPHEEEENLSAWATRGAPLSPSAIPILRASAFAFLPAKPPATWEASNRPPKHRTWTLNTSPPL